MSTPKAEIVHAVITPGVRDNPESAYVTIGNVRYEIPVLTWDKIERAWPVMNEITELSGTGENPTPQELNLLFNRRVNTTLELISIGISDEHPEMDVLSLRKALRFPEVSGVMSCFVEIMTKAGLSGEVSPV